MQLTEILNKVEENLTIFDAFVKANSIINDSKYKKIMCSISGGSDSDVMLDLLTKIDYRKKITYVWFNTGIEYQATKDHLIYLEEKYGIEIVREKAVKPIPLSNRLYGEPFLSKQVSEMIQRGQKHGFKFEDKPYDELIKEYPNCTSVVKWWCNMWSDNPEKSKFNINRNKWLKEFLILNPPRFAIANKCCTYAKKNVAKNYIKNNNIDLNIFGVRKAEGGIRAAGKTCFTGSDDKKKVDVYKPLFWFSDEDKRAYEKIFHVKHSDCYEKYGMKRTGCAGCPFNKKFDDEKYVIDLYEPKLSKAVDKIFKESYEYTRAYRLFALQQKEIQKQPEGIKQYSLFDFIEEGIK